MENAVGYDPGPANVYSVAGYNGSADVADAYVYSGSVQAWTAVGGWDTSGTG